jgi:tetratricopeptide (TPR) repeat protein
MLREGLEQYDPSAAFAYYYRGLVLSRMGQLDRALRSFKEALVSELHRADPDGLNLRLFRDKIREAEATFTSPQSPPQSLSPPPR